MRKATLSGVAQNRDPSRHATYSGKQIENRLSSEVDLIPGGATEGKTSATSTSGDQRASDERLLLTNEFIASLPRSSVPVEVAGAGDWLNWLALDSRQTFKLTRRAFFRESMSANLFASPKPRMTAYRTFRFDVREAYLTLSKNGRFFTTLGRYNLKNGVASGFNPTDFFRTASVRITDTNDVTALREGRLGTFMAHSEYFGNDINVALAVAPQLSRRYDRSYYKLDDMFALGLARTNPTWREQVQLSFPRYTRFAPTLLAYHDAQAIKFGASSAFLLTDRATGYIEWAGWNRKSVIQDGLTDTFKAGLLPRIVYGDHGEPHFRQQLAAGVTYSFNPNLSLSLEFDFNEGGLTRGALRAFTRFGQSNGLGKAAYWSIRRYATAQQDPIARDTGFLRVSWADFLIKKLNFSAIAQINLDDLSSATQASLSYRFRQGWGIDLQGNYTAGERAGEYASLPQAGAFLTRINKFF